MIATQYQGDAENVLEVKEVNDFNDAKEGMDVLHQMEMIMLKELKTTFYSQWM